MLCKTRPLPVFVNGDDDGCPFEVADWMEQENHSRLPNEIFIDAMRVFVYASHSCAAHVVEPGELKVLLCAALLGETNMEPNKKCAPSHSRTRHRHQSRRYRTLRIKCEELFTVEAGHKRWVCASQVAIERRNA